MVLPFSVTGSKWQKKNRVGVAGVIENLTNLTFASYGHIERKGIQAAMQEYHYHLMKQRDIEDKRVPVLYISRSAPVLLDIIDGSAVLLAGHSPEQLETFLLDKTVVIKKDIYFYVIPLLSSAKIAIASQEIQTEEIGERQVQTAVTPAMEVETLYTLLYHEKELGFRFKGEQHECWELTYVDKGSMYNVVEGKEYALHQGDMMLFAPGQWHSQYADDTVSVCYMTVTFGMHLMEPDLLTDRAFQSDHEIRSLLEKIMQEKETHPIYSDDLILCYLKEILIRLLRAQKLEHIISKADTEMKHTIESDIISDVMQYVKNNLDKKLTVSQIAKTIPVSSSYLSTLFRKNTGKHLVEYISAEKMKRAKEYMRERKYTFTQISEMLGFNSIHYFSKLFKKQFGITPSEYTNSIKK